MREEVEAGRGGDNTSFRTQRDVHTESLPDEIDVAAPIDRGEDTWLAVSHPLLQLTQDVHLSVAVTA